jgi:AcrR family transcriptional regulator
MSKVGRPRIHLHLSREMLAHAGLALIDRDGLETLSLRRLAIELGVGTTTLYGHVRTRDEIDRDIVGLLLDEVDTAERPGESWDDGLRRVTGSVREMALRHPRAFALVASAPVDEPPVLDHARAVAKLQIAEGMTVEQFVDSWKVVDGFVTGFLIMETASIARTLAAEGNEASAGRSDRFERAMSQVHSGEAFEEAIEVIVAGLQQRGLPASR